MQSKLGQIVLRVARENPELRHLLVREIRSAGFMPTMPRESYLPAEVRGTDPITPEGTDLMIWKYETPKGYPCAIAFAAKQQKPLMNAIFRNDAQREREIQETIAKRKRSLKFNAERAQEKKQFSHDYKEGDILCASWGYDQTNINFYQVTRVIGKQIEIREIESRIVSQKIGADYVVAAPNKFLGPPMKKTPQLGGYVKINSSASASKWDGKPEYETGSGFGH